MIKELMNNWNIFHIRKENIYMCGRFAWFNKSTEIIDSFKTVDLNIEKNPIADIPSYNIAPSQKIIVIESESKTSIRIESKTFRFGASRPGEGEGDYNRN